jgi:hypothetical protein
MKSPEFHYRLARPVAGARPGAHRGPSAGDGTVFRHLAAFIEHPDPRRLDVRASLRDPFERLWVRRHEQPAAIGVHALADLSGSMAYRGVHPKPAVLADFIDGLAASVHRAGDRLGIVAADDRLLPEFCLPPVREPGPAHELAGRLRRFPLRGAGARGLLAAARRLPARRVLVFLLSDFHFPLPLLRELLASLARHDTVPVVLWDAGERLPGPAGLARLVDLEGGGERLLWLRPALRERLADRLGERRARLGELFRRFGREPLFLDEGFDPDRVTAYFHGARR